MAGDKSFRVPGSVAGTTMAGLISNDNSSVAGSPMWTDYAVMGKFETGRVYVVYQDKNVGVLIVSTWFTRVESSGNSRESDY